jgi:hypothetical protein
MKNTNKKYQFILKVESHVNQKTTMNYIKNSLRFTGTFDDKKIIIKPINFFKTAMENLYGVK